MSDADTGIIGFPLELLETKGDGFVGRLELGPPQQIAVLVLSDGQRIVSFIRNGQTLGTMHLTLRGAIYLADLLIG